MISFTGSTAVGRRIMEKGAATSKRVFLELGGKSAMIVLDDADSARRCRSAVMACMHAGQGCAMPDAAAACRARATTRPSRSSRPAFEACPYGDPTDPAQHQRPAGQRKQQERVLGYIEKGRAEGADVVVGGGRPAHLPKGYFVEPTLFVDVDNSMTIAQEEIFGPVLVVIPFDDDEDAIRIANDAAYGLSGGVFSGRRGAGDRRSRAGSAPGRSAVNGGMWYGADSPYGGYKTERHRPPVWP